MTPRYIKVNGVKYGVKKVKLPSDSLGGVDMENNIIYLKRKSEHNSQLMTLCHEIIHIWNSQLEEVQVEWLGLALFALLKENPQLRRSFD